MGCFRVGSKLPLPLYADVRLHIPMTHRNDAGTTGTESHAVAFLRPSSCAAAAVILAFELVLSVSFRRFQCRFVFYYCAFISRANTRTLSFSLLYSTHYTRKHARHHTVPLPPLTGLLAYSRFLARKYGTVTVHSRLCTLLLLHFSCTGLFNSRTQGWNTAWYWGSEMVGVRTLYKYALLLPLLLHLPAMCSFCVKKFERERVCMCVCVRVCVSVSVCVRTCMRACVCVWRRDGKAVLVYADMQDRAMPARTMRIGNTRYVTHVTAALITRR